MLANHRAFSGIAVKDLAAARRFYAETLGLDVSEENGMLWLRHTADHGTLVYEQPAAVAASYTVLNFEVDDIDRAVAELTERGVTFARYDGIEQDEHGIFREGGPFIAWFEDPSGNVLSVLQERS
jgi:predicted enzyme related to lactoylglutathione lyase